MHRKPLPLALLIGAVLATPVAAAASAALPAASTDLPAVHVTAASPTIRLEVPGTVSTIDRQ